MCNSDEAERALFISKRHFPDVNLFTAELKLTESTKYLRVTLDFKLAFWVT